jgi:hypothetical protein
VDPNEDRQHHPIQRQAPSLEEDQAQALNLLRPTTIIASTQRECHPKFLFRSIVFCIWSDCSQHVIGLCWIKGFFLKSGFILHDNWYGMVFSERPYKYLNYLSRYFKESAESILFISLLNQVDHDHSIRP